MKILHIILLLSNTQGLDSIFDQSNAFYTDGKYQMAIDGYKDILNSGFELSLIHI